MDNPTETLLAEISSFLKRTGTPPSVFGELAVNDRSLVRGLKAGREPRFRTIQRVRKFIAQAQKGSAR